MVSKNYDQFNKDVDLLQPNCRERDASDYSPTIADLYYGFSSKSFSSKIRDIYIRQVSPT